MATRLFFTVLFLVIGKKCISETTNDLFQCLNHDDGKTVFDKCNQRCVCIGGKLEKCTRLRKEYTSMTQEEKQSYIKAVKVLSTSPAYKALYEQNITLHKILFDYRSNIHHLNYFLPWHRWYILQYENLLRQIDCRITLPYWDWSIVGGDPYKSDIWSPQDGFGGNGDGPPDFCVIDGPFRTPHWSVVTTAGGGCLRRNFSGPVPDALKIRQLIFENSDPKKFPVFSNSLEHYHDIVHCAINGDMCEHTASTAPEFFLHHGFIDKIWTEWQQLSNENKFNTYFMEQECVMPATPYRSREFLDVENLPDSHEKFVRVEYLDPEMLLYSIIKNLTLEQLHMVPQVQLPRISDKGAQLFHTTKLLLENPPKPVIPLNKDDLHGLDLILGFRLKDLEKIATITLPKGKKKNKTKKKKYNSLFQYEAISPDKIILNGKFKK